MSFFKKRAETIDYDKLAEAIVKAKSKNDKEDIKKAIIEANKEIEESKPKQKYISGFYKYVITWTLFIIIVIGIVSFLYSVWFIITNFAELSLQADVGKRTIVGMAEFMVVSIVVTIYSILLFKEINRFNDAGILSSLFSNIIAFVALIVAAIALIKD